MKFLICGLGSIGRRHLRNLVALGQTDILLYRTHQSTLPDDELDAYPVETDLSAAFAHKPDAVIIANPTGLHMQTAIPAAQAGCHILLEKSISHSMERVDEFARIVEQNGVRVLVGYQYRYHPALLQIVDLLKEGAIGRPLSVRAHWGEYLPGWHPWEDYRQSYSARKELGGGVIFNLTHALDYLRWLFGEVSELSAFTGQLSDLELDDVEDTAEISLRFASGVLASLHLDYNQRPPRQHMEIIGTQGTLEWEYQQPTFRHYNATDKEWHTHNLPAGFERNMLFENQMAHFIEVVQEEAEPRCTLEDGIWALHLALAAHESDSSGKKIFFTKS